MALNGRWEKVRRALDNKGVFEEPTDHDLIWIDIVFPDNTFSREEKVTLFRQNALSGFEFSHAKCREILTQKSDEELAGKDMPDGIPQGLQD